jgi:hypothetical protein
VSAQPWTPHATHLAHATDATFITRDPRDRLNSCI